MTIMGRHHDPRALAVDVGVIRVTVTLHILDGVVFGALSAGTAIDTTNSDDAMMPVIVAGALVNAHFLLTH